MNPQSGYLISPRARGKVRHYFHKLDHDANLEAGHRILEQTLKRWKVVADNEHLLKHFSKDSIDGVLVDIGRGAIRQTQLDALFRPETPKKRISSHPEKAASVSRSQHRVSGVDDLLTRLGKCCKPIPGDDVIGYITLGEGVTVHKQNCSNIIHLPEARQNRLIDIDWGSDTETYMVDVEIEAYNRDGILNDITQLLSSLRINLIRADSRLEDSDQLKMVEITIQISDSEELSLVLNRLQQVKNVISAGRTI